MSIQQTPPSPFPSIPKSQPLVGIKTHWEVNPTGRMLLLVIPRALFFNVVIILVAESKLSYNSHAPDLIIKPPANASAV